MQLVIAAITTSPSLSGRASWPAWPDPDVSSGTWPDLGRAPECVAVRRSRPSQRHPVLRAARPGQARHDARKVELHGLGIDGLAVGLVPEPLLLGVGLDQREMLVIAPCETQVVDGGAVDRKDRAGRAVFGRHVPDRGPVLDRYGPDPRPERLHEFSNHAVTTKQLGDREDQIGRRRPFGHLAEQPQPDDGRQQHGQWLTEHGRLGLDPPDAPAQHAQPVDHGGMRVGAHKGVAVRLS